MAIVRYDPIRDIDSMNKLFDGIFGSRTGEAGRPHSRWVPPMDLVEAGDALVLRADLPGMTEEDIAIEIKDDVLTISGERSSEHEQKGESFYRAERAFGSFSRSLTLPDGIDPDAVAASFANGVLEVRVPKPAERKPHRVAIGRGAVEGEATER